MSTDDDDEARRPGAGAINLDPASIDLFRKTAKKYTEEETKLNKEIVEKGIVGQWIGKLEYQPGNIAFIAISGLLIILLVSIFGLICIDATQEKGLGKIENLKSVILAILGLTGTILGYIFGKNSNSEQAPAKKEDNQIPR